MVSQTLKTIQNTRYDFTDRRMTEIDLVETISILLAVLDFKNCVLTNNAIKTHLNATSLATFGTFHQYEYNHDTELKQESKE